MVPRLPVWQSPPSNVLKDSMTDAASLPRWDMTPYYAGLDDPALVADWCRPTKMELPSGTPFAGLWIRNYSA
jgi:hypothetical protein